jgi:IstB-like ATP binding protein
VRLTRRLRMPYLRKAALDVVPTARAQRSRPRRGPARAAQRGGRRPGRGHRPAAPPPRRLPRRQDLRGLGRSPLLHPLPTQQALRTLEWVDRRENPCVCGPSGTGKSHFCEALGQLAIDAGRTVAWFAIDELGALVRRHRADDTVARAITRITRADPIVVDDIGMLPIGPDAAEGFYRLVDAAYERRSPAVSSNLHPAGFDELMPKTLATATVDRLLHHAHVCVTKASRSGSPRPPPARG